MAPPLVPSGRSVKRAPELIEFLADPMEIEETTAPILLRITLYAAVALVTCTLLWATLSRVDEIVNAPCKITSTEANLVLSPLETSIIRSVDIHVGDIVHKDDPIAHLDPTFTAADITSFSTQKVALEAERDRLTNELAGTLYEVSKEPSEAEIQQSKLGKARAEEYRAKLDSFAAKETQITHDLDSRKAEIVLASQRNAVLTEVESMRTSLEKSGSGSRLNALESTKSRLESERDLQQAEHSIDDLEQQLLTVRADREAYVSQWRRETDQQLVTVERDLRTAVQQLTKSQRRHEMGVVRAPVDAIVLEVAPRSVGSVVREAETIATLVRLDGPLELDAVLKTSDIGHVAVNDTVRVKLDSAPFQSHGFLFGRVSVISQDTFTPDKEEGKPQGQSVYHVRVTIDKNELYNMRTTFRLLPGMTGVAEIRVGTRRLISYLVYPLMRGLEESFREP